ncbi:MAG: nascent polypeptide-associated complex protein [Candidatus Micrarchaeota archaeon]|nr:nascent polypeptide-associated complex protein [Candidatus Micrarchaeota archaeon]
MLGGLGGMNPGQMKKLMQQMGIKNTEVKATRVVIESEDGNLVVENPQVTMIEMGGQKSLQVIGEIQQQAPGESSSTGNSGSKTAEKSDVEIVMEKAGCSKETAEKALKEANGDMVDAIMIAENNK